MEFANAMGVVKWANKDILRTAGWKEEQLIAALEALKKKANDLYYVSREHCW